ncbi:Ig-like domain-containing protein, partial [Flavobacterium flavipallidum]
FNVVDGAFTQTFQIGGRENGIQIDKFVFGSGTESFTVKELENFEKIQNNPPVAVFDQISVSEGATTNTLVGGETNVLANDTDAENNSLTAALVSNVTNGILTFNSDGTFTYVHNGSETTSDSFTYKANDGTSNSNVVTVNITIVPFSLASNNFSIESKSETCVNKNNGEIIINALENYNYVANINGVNYPLVGNSLTVSSLAPGTYPVCITITGKSFEQCFSVNIASAGSVTGKTTISSDKVAVEITEGTAPYQIYVNGDKKFETAVSNFTVSVQQGDLLEVKTAKDCEGVYSKSIMGLSENIVAFPNPTHGLVEIFAPTTKNEVNVELYTSGGQLVSKANYIIVNHVIQLDLGRLTTGVYLVKVYLDNLVSVKIIKY